jgi:hypothetical protein
MNVSISEGDMFLRSIFSAERGIPSLTAGLTHT